MGILEDATPTTAFAKIAMHGPQGSGKTFTAVQILLGLSKRYGNGAPIAFVDTEKGSDHYIELFAASKVRLLRIKTRNFSHLLTAFREAEKLGCSGIIVDSVTHFWEELRIGYERRLNRSHGLHLKDWGPLKAEWGQFPKALLNSQLHVIACGRAGVQFEERLDEHGEIESFRSGTKFKAEGDFAYEPDLQLEMRALRKKDRNGDPLPEGGFDHICVVLKDRTLFVNRETGVVKPRLNGKVFINPTFADFQPFFDAINIGGTHVGVSAAKPEDGVAVEAAEDAAVAQARAIAIERLEAEFTARGITGRTEDGRKSLARWLNAAFGTMSWTEITTSPADAIECGNERLRLLFRGVDACERGDHDWKPTKRGGEACGRGGCDAARRKAADKEPAP